MKIGDARMQVLSVQVGRPRDVLWRGEVVSTGIYKNPVAGPVDVHRLNLEGDEQADLTVHGGLYKAVYCYASEHYPGWRTELPDTQLEWGAFGENLTVTGLIENDVRIGDQLRIGTAEFVVTQPRSPCYKLAIKFGRTDILKRLLRGQRTGFYLAVTKEGVLSAGDAIERTPADGDSETIAEVVRRFWT